MGERSLQYACQACNSNCFCHFYFCFKCIYLLYFFPCHNSYLLILLAIFFILSIFSNLILFYLFTCNTFSVTYRLAYLHCFLTIIIFGIQHTFLRPPPAISHPCLNSVHRFTPVRTPSYVSTSLLPFPVQT